MLPQLGHQWWREANLSDAWSFSFFQSFVWSPDGFQSLNPILRFFKETLIQSFIDGLSGNWVAHAEKCIEVSCRILTFRPTCDGNLFLCLYTISHFLNIFILELQAFYLAFFYLLCLLSLFLNNYYDTMLLHLNNCDTSLFQLTWVYLSLFEFKVSQSI